jgi:dodecin
MSVYRVTEIIGTSNRSWEDAAQQAVSAAARSLRDLRVAEVMEQDLTIAEDGTIESYRTKLRLSFKYEQPIGAPEWESQDARRSVPA